MSWRRSCCLLSAAAIAGNHQYVLLQSFPYLVDVAAAPKLGRGGNKSGSRNFVDDRRYKMRRSKRRRTNSTNTSERNSHVNKRIPKESLNGFHWLEMGGWYLVVNFVWIGSIKPCRKLETCQSINYSDVKLSDTDRNRLSTHWNGCTVHHIYVQLCLKNFIFEVTNLKGFTND